MSREFVWLDLDNFKYKLNIESSIRWQELNPSKYLRYCEFYDISSFSGL